MSASLNPVLASDAAPSLTLRERDREGPFERINAVGDQTTRVWMLSWLAAIVFHALGAGTSVLGSIEIRNFVELVQDHVENRLNASIDIEEERIEEEPPPSEPEPEPEVEEPEPLPEPLPQPTTPPPDTAVPAEAPPPAAAEAAQVLTADPEPDAPLDLTSEGFISGTGTRFAGGVTAGSGTAKTAVRDRGATGAGVVGAQGPPSPTPVPVQDKSRPAGLPVGANWSNCPFPPEADAEQIHQAAVRIVVFVDLSGTPTSVSVLSDPGFGFGRQAQKCAMRFKYPVGLDKFGKPVASATKPFRVTFTR